MNLAHAFFLLLFIYLLDVFSKNFDSFCHMISEILTTFWYFLFNIYFILNFNYVNIKVYSENNESPNLRVRWMAYLQTKSNLKFELYDCKFWGGRWDEEVSFSPP